MSDPIVLKIYRGARLISVKQYTQDQVVIGRKSDSNLTLDDENVSPLHAVIEKKGEDYFLSDLGSESGIAIEGVRILETEIQNGEAFTVGPYSVRFYIGVPKPPIPPDFDKEHTLPPKRKKPSSTTTYPETSVEINDDDVDDTLDEPDEFEYVDDEVTDPGLLRDFSEDDHEVTDAGETFDSVEVTDPGIRIKTSSIFPFEDEKGSQTESSQAKAQHSTVSQTETSDSKAPQPKGQQSPPPKQKPTQAKSQQTGRPKSSLNIKKQTPEEQIKRQFKEPLSSGYVAPKSSYDNVEEIIDPNSRGSIVEIIICWKERVLKTYHFSNNKKIYLSNLDNQDVYVPLFGPEFKHHLLTLGENCTVHVASSMSAVIYKNKESYDLSGIVGDPQISKSASRTDVNLDQGQMIKLSLLSDKVEAYIRYVEDAPQAKMAPVFDLTSSEMVGFFMSVASILIVSLYMLFYAPLEINDTDKLLEDRLRKAVITFNPPPPRAKIPEIPTQKSVEPIKEKKVTKITEKKGKPTSSVKKIKGQKKAGVKNPSVDNTKKPGKPKQAAPSRTKTTNKVGSSRPGGSVKTGKKAANMETKKKDLTKTGLLSVLSGGGKNSLLDKASSGVGQTIGTADSKTGYQGQVSDQAGEGIGAKLQRAGKGGKGSALAGGSDVNTSGRAGGDGGYGVAGLGGKGTSTIVNVEGAGGEFSSSIDKDAIRRLIRRNRNAIRGCYERALVQNSTLSGKVTLSWKIAEGGRMIEPKVKSSSLNNSEVEQCLVRRLMGLTFPSPAANEIAEVESYPFVFESKN